MKTRVLSYLFTVLLVSSCSSVRESSVDEILKPGHLPAGRVSTLEETRRAVVSPKKSEPMIRPTIDLKGYDSERIAPPVKPQMPGSRISRVSVPDRVVALTFDDGPHGSLTPRVLEILNRYNAKGTFFVLGSNAVRQPALLQRMISGGHEVGSHTWNHMNMSRASRTVIEADMQKTNEAIIGACGVKPRVMRPPYGAGGVPLASWIKDRFSATTVLWDVDTNDWRKPGVQTVINRAVNGARPGSIILVHDIHKSTVDAVEGIVKGLKARGFQLVTVSELMDRGRNYARKAEPLVPLVPSLPVMPGSAVSVDAQSSPDAEEAQSNSTI